MSKDPTHNFNSIAYVYDTLASGVFGNSIRQAQLATIPFINEGTSVLVIGGGTGWYLQQLLLEKKLAKVVYIEASEKMIALTKKKIAFALSDPNSLIDLRLGTEEAIYMHEQFDVIITHFFLDIFAPARLQKVVDTLNRALKPDGLWLIADFRVSDQVHANSYWWKKILVGTMYLFFRTVCHISGNKLPDFKQLFHQLHMHQWQEYVFLNDLIFSAVYARRTKSN